MSEDEYAEWQLEWENYFDDIEDTLKLLDTLANKAIDEGFRNEQLIVTLIEAGTALIRHCHVCDEYLNAENWRVTMEIYRQNPLLKTLLSNAKSSLGLPAEPDERPDDGDGVERERC